MECLICLDKMEKDIVKNKYCKCNIFFHKKCLEYFYKNSNLNCPICRKKKNIPSVITRPQYDPDIFMFDCFQLLFSYSPLIALPIWFIIYTIFCLLPFYIIYIII